MDQSTKANEKEGETIVQLPRLLKESNEKEGETIVVATEVVEGEGVATGGANDEAQIKADYVEEIVSVP